MKSTKGYRTNKSTCKTITWKGMTQVSRHGFTGTVLSVRFS